jgi:hypothetical protein
MTLAAAVFIALHAWAPAVPVATVQTFADAIALAAKAHGYGERFALELAAVAVEESGLADYVLSGQCNDPDWRGSPEGKKAMTRGSCDGGFAVGAWQIHARSGGPSVRDLLDVSTAAGIAAVLWARSPYIWTTWPKATKRVAAWQTARR